MPAHRSLAAQFDVAPKTVREPVQRLTAVGLLQSRPGKGNWVRPDALEALVHPAVIEARLGTVDRRHLLEARSAIEVGLTELAASRATQEDIDAISRAIDAMDRAIVDHGEMARADARFHLLVARASHSEVLAQFYHTVRSMLSGVIDQTANLPGATETDSRIQRRIASAIKDHNPRRARRAAVDHARLADVLLDALESETVIQHIRDGTAVRSATISAGASHTVSRARHIVKSVPA